MVISKTITGPYRSIFAVGDVHGRARKLRALIERIPFDPVCDVLVFLGDYIDRGKDSREVVEIVRGLQAASERVICLRGNHEQMFLDVLGGADPLLYFWNGGRATFTSYRAWEDERGCYHVPIPESHHLFLERLPHYVETDRYLFVHAGLRPGVPLTEQTPEDLLWIRHEFIFSVLPLEKKVIFGHTPFHEPLVMDDKIGIDTGAGYGGQLTCVQLPDEVFYQI